ELLVAEEQHLPLEQRAADLVAHLVVEWFGKVDAVHLGADHIRVRLDLQPLVRTINPIVGGAAQDTRSDPPCHRSSQSGLLHAYPKLGEGSDMIEQVIEKWHAN